MTMINYRKTNLLRCMLIVYLIMLVTSSCQSLGRRYDEEWNRRLSDVETFNTYANKNKGTVHLKDLSLENYELNGMQVQTLVIENSSLNKIVAHKAHIGKLVIINSDLSEVFMHYSYIRELTINNSNLEKVELGINNITETIIDKSNFNECSIEIDSEDALIENTLIKRSTFTGSEFGTLKIVRTKFDANKMNYFGSNTIDSLFIKDSSLNVEFQESKIKNTVLENVTGVRAGFARMEGDSFLIKESNLKGISLGGSKTKLNFFESTNSSFYGLGFQSATVGQIVVRGCPKTTGLSFSESKVMNIKIEKCNLNHLQLNESFIDSFSIANSEILIPDSLFDGIWDKMHIKTFVFDNVFIQGPFDMQNARIDNLVKNNLRKSDYLNIKYEGANFRL